MPAMRHFSTIYSLRTAIMDKILHHTHVVPISGKSYRLKDHLRQPD
ncbi:ATP-binding protein [Gemella morbillorum]